MGQFARNENGGPTLRVLLVNDDGIHGRGVWALAEELTKIAEVHVVVPDREQSGVGTSITLHRPLRVNKIDHWHGVKSAHSIDGTPADCTILGLRSLVKETVDVVVSGINDGANLGNDAFISGTVSAALQGFFYGIPSIAVSVTALENAKYAAAASFTSHLVKEIAAGNPTEKVFLNVNVPNRPLEQIQGVYVTRFAKRSYVDHIDEKVDSRGKAYYWILRGTPEWEVEEGTDIWALRNKYISINHLHTDLACLTEQDSVKNLCDQAFNAIKFGVSSD